VQNEDNWVVTKCHKLYRQALLKAKYCQRPAPVASAGSNKVAPSSEWHRGI